MPVFLGIFHNIVQFIVQHQFAVVRTVRGRPGSVTVSWAVMARARACDLRSPSAAPVTSHGGGRVDQDAAAASHGARGQPECRRHRVTGPGPPAAPTKPAGGHQAESRSSDDDDHPPTPRQSDSELS